MVKVTSEDNSDHTKDLLQKTKDGFIQKKKNKKFKQTPAGKIALINGSKSSNGNIEQKEQPSNKQKKSDSKKSPEQRTKDSPKADKKLQENPKKHKAQSEEDDSDSDEDINEGIVLEEHSFMQESSEAASEGEEESEDESGDERSLPNILGTSLADDTDEDDDDYEEDEEAVEVNKGVKMFKGLKSKDKTNDLSEKKSMDQSELSDDDDEDVDEEDDEGEDDEGDFEADSSDDEEESDVEDEDNDEEDEDDDDEEESEDEEGDESMISWEAILGNSIVEDDEDDEDFNEPENMDEDDDDDISDEDEDEEEEENSHSRSSAKDKTKKPKESVDASLEELKEDKRTIFVGNLPKEVTRKQLKKHFKKYGTIDTVRVRGIIGKSMKMSKKVAAIKNDLHPKLKSVFAYIKYKSEESAKAALSMNGKLFDGNHLRVDLASRQDEKHDVKKAVFIGNIHFSIDENTIRKHFKGCGEIESIRIVRDNKTGIGKGFGYINFETEDSVALALELNGTSLLNREIRVQPCSDHPKKDKKDKQKKRPSSSEEEKKSNKKFKKNEEVVVSGHNKKNAMKTINDKGQKSDAKQASPQQSKAFQGQTSEGKKKKKSNKSEKKKKAMAEKLAAKPKKPAN